MKRVWYVNKFNTLISMITDRSDDRPGEKSFLAQCDDDPDKYNILWTGNTPSIVDDPTYTNRKKLKNQERMWEQIKGSRDARKGGGFKVGDKWFHSDDSSRIQQLGLYVLGSGVPAVLWKTMDGTFVAMTPTLAGQIFQAALTLDSTLFTVAEAHKTAMEAAAHPLQYDYSTGWPENFLGI